MKLKLQQKLKDKCNFDKLTEPYEPYKLDEKRIVFLLPNIFATAEQLKMAEVVINKILLICTEKLHENIAVNIDIEDNKSYFNFKTVFQTLFKNKTI